ncbi:MAG TPA: carboxypeptidase regulatory-like domain-containing protein [Blastocatellia bacterium]|nr:carboxypeptidase regulatory-like domain-containing protein [Blastocatellia bacterium]
MQSRHSRLLTAAFGMTLLLPIIIFAQQAGSLRGQVVDELGAVIPGATITLTPNEGGKARTVNAGVTGDFVMSNIAPGSYTLTAEFRGFGKYVQNDLRVPQKEPLRITLAVAAVSVVTDVAADSKTVSVEPDQNLTATVLDEEFIKNNLPDNEDDLRAYLQALAGPAAGAVSGGQGQAQIFVDGFNGARLPPREAILQIRVNQNPFTAEFSNPGFGRIEIITKPGRDQWRGTVSFNVRNSALDARNAFATVKPDISQERYGFNMSGPIIANKMSFFANYDQRSLEGGSTVTATTLDGRQVFNVQAPNRSRNLMARADYLINNRNTLNANYSFFGSESENREFAVRFGGFGGGPGGGGPGGGGFGGFGLVAAASGSGNYTLPERGSNSTNANHTLRLSETFIINSSLALESRLQLQRESSRATAVTSGVAINTLDAFNGGGATCCPSETRATGGEWQEYLTWTKKKHTLKFGLQMLYDNVRDYSENNFNGTFTFANLEQYRQAINNPQTARAQQFTINIGDPLLRYSRAEYSWFAQEDWRFRPTLTLSFGLRHEFQSQLDDKNNFAPRVGVAWSPFRDRKTVFRFGGGLFYQRLTGNLYENTLRYDGVTQQSVVIRNPLYPDPFAGDPDISIKNTIRRTLDPDLNAPYTINFSSSVERQLPYGLNGSASYVYARGVHQFRMRNINAPLAGVSDPFDLESGARPFGDIGNLYQIESSASSKYNGFLFRLDRRLGRSFMLFGNYTLSWTKSDSDGAMSLPADNYNLAAEWGRAYTDRRHSVFIGGRISLPYKFNLSPMITASSGSPFSVTTGFDENGDTNLNDRPAGLARNADLPASLYSLIPNRCVSGCQGDAPVLLRDYLIANFPNGVKAENPGSFNANLSISRAFSFGERKNPSAQQGPGGFPGGGGPPPMGPGGMGGGPFGGGSENGRFNVQLTAQITNLFNRVNFGSYSGVLGSPYFLQPSSAGGARQFELGVRFSF